MMSRLPFFFILLSHLLASSSSSSSSVYLPNNHYTGWMLDPEWYQDSGDSFHSPNLPYHPAQLHSSDASRSSPAAAEYASHPYFSSQDFPKGNSRVPPQVDFSNEPLAYEVGEWSTDPEFFNEPLPGVESAAEDADFEPQSSMGLNGFFAQLKSRLYGFRTVSEEESVPNAFQFIRDKKKTARRSLRAI